MFPGSAGDLGWSASWVAVSKMEYSFPKAILSVWYVSDLSGHPTYEEKCCEQQNRYAYHMDPDVHLGGGYWSTPSHLPNEGTYGVVVVRSILKATCQILHKKARALRITYEDELFL